MTKNTTTQLEKKIYDICTGYNAEVREREEAIDRETAEMVTAIENAQARIAEILRFAGAEVKS